jgi:hypothetical protein
VCGSLRTSYGQSGKRPVTHDCSQDTNRDTLGQMRRIGYRGVLPIVALLVYASLIWLGCPYIQLDRQAAPAKSATSPDGEPAWDIHCLWTTMPIPEQLAVGLNLPAAIAAFVLGPLRNRMHLVCREAEYFDHAAMGLFVPILWCFVGLQIDKIGSSRFRRNTRLRRFFAFAVVFILSTAAVLVSASFFLGPPEFLVMRMCALGWLVFGSCAFVPIRKALAMTFRFMSNRV